MKGQLTPKLERNSSGKLSLHFVVSSLTVILLTNVNSSNPKADHDESRNIKHLHRGQTIDPVYHLRQSSPALMQTTTEQTLTNPLRSRFTLTLQSLLCLLLF